MGQRHQLFVIARIAARYRCLAAVHHQSLFGSQILRRCRDLIDIFRDLRNRVALVEELHMAEHADDDLWDLSAAEKANNFYYDPDVPFPFIMTCLMLETSFDADEGHFHRVHIQPFKASCTDVDNNTGKRGYCSSRHSLPTNLNRNHNNRCFGPRRRSLLLRRHHRHHKRIRE